MRPAPRQFTGPQPRRATAAARVRGLALVLACVLASGAAAQDAPPAEPPIDAPPAAPAIDEPAPPADDAGAVEPAVETPVEAPAEPVAGPRDAAVKALDEQVKLLTARLVETFEKLYVATPEADRPKLLLAMLDDAVTDVRLQALRLIERKVLNAQPIDDSVRQKVRTLLDDGSPRVRAATASLLRTVDDAPAAGLVLARLGDEKDPAVINAYLTLLARKPTAEAVEPALDYLSKPATSAAAADLLIRALEAKLLTEPQKADALERAVTLANADGDVEPMAVRLAGRLATENQAALMKKLLDAPSEAVRLAAAEAYVHGTLPIEPLLARLSDPVLGPRAVDAAARRADTLAVALDLLSREPADPDQRQPWRNAIAAIAGRLNAADLRKLDDALLQARNHEALRATVLRGATALPPGAYAPDRAELLLRLGELQAEAGQTEALGRTLDAIDPTEVGQTNQARLLRLRMEQQLSLGRYDEALGTAEALMAADSAVASWITAELLDAVEKALGARKTEQAGAVLGRLQTMVGPTMSQADRQRYEKLRGQLDELLKPAAPPDSPAG